MLSQRIMMMADGSPMLYDHGLTFNGKTGGWEQDTAYTPSNCSAVKIPLSADCMLVDVASTYDYLYYYRCTTPIDITQWDSVKISYSASYGSGIYARVRVDTSPGASGKWVDLPSTSGQEAEASLDISGIAGSRYIYVYCYKNTNSKLPVKFSAFKIWLE